MKKIISSVLFLAMSLCVGIAGAGCEESACNHEFGAWTTVKESTCSEQGKQERVCKLCGEKEDQPLELSAHVWDEGEETTPATCLAEGVKTYHCLNNPEHTRTEKIPKKSHTYSQEYTTDIAATETEDGLESRHCTTPGCTARTEERTIPKTGPAEPENPEGPEGPTQPDNPTEPENPTQPDNPTEPENPTQPDNPTEPENPTQPDNPAEPENPTQPDNPEPPAEEEKITYRIQVNRWNGRTIVYYQYPTVKIYDKDHNLVHEGAVPEAPSASTEEVYNSLDVELPKGEYTVEIGNIPDGFIYEDSYKLSYKTGKKPYDKPEKYPHLEIYLKSKLLDGELTAIRQGTVMHDFTFKTYNTINNKQEFKLSELLKSKKFILLMFYQNDCPHCVEEMPFLVKNFKERINDMAFVCFNISDSDDKALSALESFQIDLDTMYFSTKANGSYDLYRKLGQNGVPRLVMIDRYGYCFYVSGGGISEERFVRILKYNLEATDLTKTSKTLFPIDSEELIPSKRDIFAEILP